MAKMLPIWSILMSHPKDLHSLTSQSRAALSEWVNVKRHMPVDGAGRAPYAVHVSCKVLFSLSPLILKRLKGIVMQMEALVALRLAWRVTNSGWTRQGREN